MRPFSNASLSRETRRSSREMVRGVKEQGADGQDQNPSREAGTLSIGKASGLRWRPLSSA